MQLDLTEDQQMLMDTFARFLSKESSSERVRVAQPLGFDRRLWQGLAELGAFGIRLPESVGGLGLGILDAGLLMEEAGRTLASGPIAETLVSASLLAKLDPSDSNELRDDIVSGRCVASIALHNVAEHPLQLVAGGAVAEVVIALDGDKVVLLRNTPRAEQAETSLASTPIDRLELSGGKSLAQGPEAVAAFQAAIEEWKLLMAMAMTGLAARSLQMAAEYATERVQFDRPIGTFQAVSHPLADIVVRIDAGRLLVWQAIRAIANSDSSAGEAVSRAAWWVFTEAEKAVAQALHTFGGYGLTLEYDIHLYNLRAKAWPLVLGDPADLLAEAARRRYGGEQVALPNAGAMEIEFGLGEEAGAFADETRQFFEKELTPELRAKAHYSFDGHDPDLHRKLAEARLLFPSWPEHMGGRNASPYVVQALLKVWDEYGWTTHFRGTCNMIGYIMDRFGSEQLKSGPLREVVEGRATCALAFSEPSAGSDVFAAKTKVWRDGDGWRIDGQKMFTSGAELAEYVLLLARNDATGPKHKGLMMFILPLKSEGISIQAVHTFQGERTNISYYDNVYVDDSYRLGEVGGGLQVMAASLEVEHGVSFVRYHEDLLRSAERLCGDTKRNGQAKLMDLGVQLRLTRSAAHIEAARLLHFRTLWSSAEGKPGPAYGPSSKMFSSEMYRTDAFDLLNLTAPESLMSTSKDAVKINLAYRHSQVTTIYGGTSEVHRSMIAEKQLGLPRSR